MIALVRFFSILIVITALSAAPVHADKGIFKFFDRSFETLTQTGSDNIVDTAIATPELSMLVQAVITAGLDGVLSEDGDFTVFAPTNDAFTAAGIDPFNDDPALLAEVLLNHVAPGNFSARFLRYEGRSAERIPTLGGLTLGFDPYPLAVNGASISRRSVAASNGRIFIIDSVLDSTAPSIADRAGEVDELSLLVQAVVNGGLLDTLNEGGPFTVFAPTNSAFRAAGIDPAYVDPDVLAEVLRDHVVRGEFTATELASLALSGSKLSTLGGLELKVRFWPFRVNGKALKGSNISAGNGIVHLIGGVLLED